MTLTCGQACSRSTKRTSSFCARLIAAFAAGRMVLTFFFCCTMITTVFTACTNDNDDNPLTPPEPEEELAECTIIWYGTGGGNKDFEIMNNFR